MSDSLRRGVGLFPLFIFPLWFPRPGYEIVAGNQHGVNAQITTRGKKNVPLPPSLVLWVSLDTTLKPGIQANSHKHQRKWNSPLAKSVPHNTRTAKIVALVAFEAERFLHRFINFQKTRKQWSTLSMCIFWRTWMLAVFLLIKLASHLLTSDLLHA